MKKIRTLKLVFSLSHVLRLTSITVFFYRMNESYMTDKITGVFERFKKSTFRTLSVYKF